MAKKMFHGLKNLADGGNAVCSGGLFMESRSRGRRLIDSWHGIRYGTIPLSFHFQKQMIQASRVVAAGWDCENPPRAGDENN
jgi:hypothetical protein